MITHFLKFDDEASAIAALPQYRAGDGWRRDMVDGPIQIVVATGATQPGPWGGPDVAVTEPVPGYFLNIGLPELDASMPGLTGAGYGPAEDFTLVHGSKPDTPQRVFA